MKKGNGFLGGIFTGVLLTLLAAFSIYTIQQFRSLAKLGDERREGAIQEGEEALLTQKTKDKLEVIEDTIDKYYYKTDVDREAMAEGMYAGVIASLGDPYSVYYTEEELNDLMEQTEGIYYGIGAYVSLDTETGLALISGVIEGTPAEEAGLRGGDIIYMVDGEITQGLELSEVVAKIKGLEGTTVKVTVYRDGEADYLEFDVERRKIESPTVNYEMLEQEIGYIQITEFGDITVTQFEHALADLRTQGMRGLILDLRGNPGGNLTSVVEISEQLLPEGLIVYTEDREGNRMEYNCDGEQEFDLPLVVLIDGYSASASEILAGAVKDYGIGTLVGTTTYGKGIVQRVLSLSDGTAIKLTVSTYYTPKGNNIHEIGVAPDEVVEFDSEQYYENEYDNQLERGKEILAEQMGVSLGGNG
ncbi:MAG: S41 family peptidase [Lachnospiraceae bacterium]|nr:S41 family peptidase [Lachnospiraceae bacterium]